MAKRLVEAPRHDGSQVPENIKAALRELCPGSGELFVCRMWQRRRWKIPREWNEAARSHRLRRCFSKLRGPRIYVELESAGTNTNEWLAEYRIVLAEIFADFAVEITNLHDLTHQPHDHSTAWKRSEAAQVGAENLH